MLEPPWRTEGERVRSTKAFTWARSTRLSHAPYCGCTGSEGRESGQSAGKHMWARLVYFLLKFRSHGGQKRRVWAGTCLVGRAIWKTARGLGDTKNTKSIWEPEEGERGLGWVGHSAGQLTKVSQGDVGPAHRDPFLELVGHRSRGRAPRGSPPGAAAAAARTSRGLSEHPAGAGTSAPGVKERRGEEGFWQMALIHHPGWESTRGLALSRGAPSPPPSSPNPPPCSPPAPGPGGKAGPG